MLKETIIYSILTTIVLGIAYIFNVLLEIALFIIYYYFIKNLFTKQFHADTIARTARAAVFLCYTITFVTQLIFIAIVASFHVSFFINIFLGIVLSICSYILEDWLERTISLNAILKDETKLIQACTNASLSKDATNRMILRYIKGKHIRDIAYMEHVEEATIWQSLRRSRKKLNITGTDI